MWMLLVRARESWGATRSKVCVNDLRWDPETAKVIVNSRLGRLYRSNFRWLPGGGQFIGSTDEQRGHNRPIHDTSGQGSITRVLEPYGLKRFASLRD
jgi:hypothetical protein